MHYQTLFERLELKYVLSEATAAALRRAILPYCDPDGYNGAAGEGYLVRSLYLDSPSLACFHAKERSDHDRIKLRARVYDESGPVSLEIKRKHGDVVRKERAAVPRERWELAAQGWLTPGADAALERFARMVAQLCAEPRVLIEYDREAFASRTDGYARITFDRRVRALPTSSWSVEASPEPLRSVMIDEAGAGLDRAVVLELKCEQRMPRWMVDLVHDFGLSRVGMSKYNSAMREVLALGTMARALLWESAHG